MADWHLEELKAQLERRGWRNLQLMPGDDYHIAASWILVRTHSRSLTIDFHAMDAMGNLMTLEQAYYCQVRDTDLSLYFRNKGKKGSAKRAGWTEELATFVDAIDRWSMDQP